MIKTISKCKTFNNFMYKTLKNSKYKFLIKSKREVRIQIILKEKSLINVNE